MKAVFETGGKQYQARPGDRVEIERIPEAPGGTATFDRVLFVENDGELTVGKPTVPNAHVVAEVLEHKRGPKQVAFKMKRRKGYHKKQGHRQPISLVRIQEIQV